MSRRLIPAVVLVMAACAPGRDPSPASAPANILPIMTGLLPPAHGIRVYGAARLAGTDTVAIRSSPIAPTYFYRSPLPVRTIRGVDANLNGENNDLPLKAYKFTSPGQASEEIGDCETWNCSRGAWRTRMNLRVSRGFALGGNARVEAIVEMFNVLNASNPAFTIVNNQRLARTIHGRGDDNIAAPVVSAATIAAAARR